MKSLLSALLLLLSFHAWAAPEAPLAGIDIPYTQHTLPNGLTLIVHEDHKAPIVTANIWYHVGSKDEKPGKTGFAHLFEHLMLNGSQHYNDDFFKPLEQIGASNINGTTNADRTNYYATVPTPALDRLLWLLSDQMGYLLPAVNQARLDEQRGVVQNEKRQNENQPYGKVNEALSAALYPAGHPYSWTTIGSMADLDRASLDDVRTWFKTWYGAGNATLVIAGDITPEEALRKTEHYFGALAGGPALSRTQQWVPKLDGEKRVSLQDRVPQTAIHIVWPVAPTTADDSTLLSLVSDVLGEGKSSRLYRRLVQADLAATQVAAFISDRELASQFHLYALLRPGADAAAAERAMKDELARFLAEGPSADELERARTGEYAAFVRSLEGVSGKSAVLAQGQIYDGTPDAYQRALRVMRDATPQQLRDTARRWLGEGRVVLTVEPIPAYQKAAQDADRRMLPAVGDTPQVRMPKFQRATLANGLQLVVAERHEAPVVQMNLLIGGGHAAGAGDKPGIAEFTAAMLGEGTTTRDAVSIAQRKEELGAVIAADAGDDASAVGLAAIRARLQPSVELFADVALHPAFATDALERMKPRRLAAIGQLSASPGGIAQRLMPALVYGDAHPYAQPNLGLGTPDSIRATTPDDLRAFYTRWYRPDNATLVVAGDITLAEARALAEQYFGAWRAPAQALPPPSLPTVALPSKPRLFLVDRPGAEQSLIHIAQLSPPRADADHQAMFVVNNVLGGKFISRLNMNLREAKHWSYGVSSGRGANRGQSLFEINAPVETAHTADSLREIDREVRALLGTRKPTAQEIREAKDAITKSLPSSIETSGQLNAQMSYMLTYGLPDDYYDTYVDKLSGLGPRQLDAAAHKLIQPQALTWIVVGDLSKIEAPIRALKLGEVQVLDAQGRVLR